MAKVKAETNLCRCCHEEGFFVNLGLPFKCSNNLEEHSLQDKSFCELIKFCFDIQITPVQENDVTYTICSMCIDSLLSAVQFKKQVISCEEKFKLMLSQKTMEKAGDEEIVSVKIEKMDEDDISESRKSPCITDDNNLFMYTNPSNNTGEKSTDETQESILFELLDTDNRGVNRRLRKRKPAPKKVPKPRIKNAKQNGKKTNEKDSRRSTILIPFEGQYVAVTEENDTKFLCKCGSLLKTPASLRAHIIRTHMTTKISCPVCNQEFQTHTKKELHLAQEHNMEEYGQGIKRMLRPAIKTRCPECKQQFPSWKLMRGHVKSAHSTLKCSECPGVFSRTELHKHKMTEHKDSLPTCNVCGYQNAVPFLVRRHQRVKHLNERNVKCDQCDLVFYNRTQLKKHLVVHNPVPKFECAHCQKKFPRKSTLLLHERIHTGLKTKVCEICGDKFVQKASLNYHMYKHHKNQ